MRVFGESRDPAYGLKPNKISGNRRVSRGLYAIDIGSTPHIIKDIGNHVGLNGEARLVNSGRRRIDKRLDKANGRY